MAPYQPARRRVPAPADCPEIPRSRRSLLSAEERLDLILDKIKQKGFDQLSQEEKDFLYDASRK